MATSNSLPKIAIIGAGPAGLTLASLLHKSHPSASQNITIFDFRSAPPNSALQIPSGSLDLHDGSGLLAIEKCGLTSKFRTLLSDCSEQTIIADKSGAIHFQDDKGAGNRPEISRNALAYLLLSSIPEPRIRWDTKIHSVTPGLNKKWKVAFGPEQTEEFDLVVGADGAWSKTRLAIPGVSKPSYSGLAYLQFTIPQLSSRYPALASLVGNGSFMAFGEHKTIVCQGGAMDSRRMYLMMAVESSSYFSDTGIDTLPPGELKTKLLGEEDFFGNWGKEMKELIAAGCDAEQEVLVRPLYTLPAEHSWTHTPGLTLIGDAANVTTPNGEGVNLAMLDALELSEVISSPPGNENQLDEGVKAFEEKMFERSKENTEDALMMKKMMFDDDDAPAEMLKFMKSAVAGVLPVQVAGLKT